MLAQVLQVPAAATGGGNGTAVSYFLRLVAAPAFAGSVSVALTGDIRSLSGGQPLDAAAPASLSFTVELQVRTGGRSAHESP